MSDLKHGSDSGDDHDHVQVHGEEHHLVPAARGPEPAGVRALQHGLQHRVLPHGHRHGQEAALEADPG